MLAVAVSCQRSAGRDWLESSAVVSAAPPCASWRLMFSWTEADDSVLQAGFDSCPWCFTDFSVLKCWVVYSPLTSDLSLSLSLSLRSSRLFVHEVDSCSDIFDACRRVLASVRTSCEHLLVLGVNTPALLFLLHSLRLWLRTRSCRWSDTFRHVGRSKGKLIFNLGHISVIWKFPACINLTVSFWFASGLMSSLFLIVWFECEEEVKRGSWLYIQLNVVYCSPLTPTL